MSEMGYAIKCLIAAVILISIMQFHFGDSTLESQAEAWVHGSKMTKFLQTVADGAIRIGKNSEHAMALLFSSERHKTSSSNEKASR